MKQPKASDMTKSIDELTQISSRIVETYGEFGGANRKDGENLPSPQKAVETLQDLLTVIFPGYFGKEVPARSNILFFIDALIDSIYVRLCEEIERALNYQCNIRDCDTNQNRSIAEKFSLELLRKIPRIRELMKMDIQAAYDGDPAAKTNDEIIMCYPCVEAIATYRIAHELYLMDVPLIPRIMTEWAHSRTGIDIHPGAQIGERFFIDHGTGVVIGETTVIGNDVKIYQGVTLGALSFPKSPDGKVVKGGKRHPTIEDNVTIYSGATILGGDTVIGKGAVIGANSWLTSSVPPGAKVTISVNQEVNQK